MCNRRVREEKVQRAQRALNAAAKALEDAKREASQSLDDDKKADME